ncbi:PKD domain-containing protein [Methanoregula sp.]|uniref:PKD domain-containing protein n=1 Tax=Methanoregula sp. TaxID=2052170 RepID=UPI0026308AA0|nr:PKD domain-containing protein [Methanoregula sp.]MDD5143462.1 PKD domain-containing protein [Methanoregula sp.]
MPTVLNADFSGTPTSGYLPRNVHFTDQSTGPIDQWSWAFGDGNTSSVPSPQYTYPDAGSYTVILTVTNTTYGITSTATKVKYIHVLSFAEYVSNESVFVYGTKLVFRGYTINGENSTIVFMGPLLSTELDGGAKINVSKIYVDGDADLGASNIALGYQPQPGNTYIHGYLKSQANLYGEVNVAGDATLTGAKIHGNVSVDGDLTVDDWKPTFDSNSYIYYTGSLITPGGDNSRCIHVDTLPGFTIPDLPLPSTKAQAWYDARGYVSGGTLTSNLKVFADSITSDSWRPSAYNVVIVARTGDITLTGLGGSTVSGVLFAPNGQVTFYGGAFEGVVIARDGFYVTSGGTTVRFKNMDEYISDSADYPF